MNGTRHILIDTTKRLDVAGRVLLGSGGFAPIPAFSFNSPILIANLILKKNAFSFEPDLAVGVNGRPWMANNWFRYRILDKKRVMVRAGVNPFLFYYDEKQDTGEDKIHIQRNLTFEMFTEIAASGSTSIDILYRHNNGWDGALTGEFISLKCIQRIAPGKTVSAEIKPELFYFNFTGTLDGFFGSITLEIKHSKVPVSLYCQGVQPFWAGFDGTSFRFIAGIVYNF